MHTIVPMVFLRLCKVITVGSLILAVMENVASGQHVRYVDEDAPLGGDGQSWDSAFTDLQSALSEAAGDTTISEIRIGEGVYRPGELRSDSFELVVGVSVLGGHAGYGAVEPDERNVATFITILSGDIGIHDETDDNSFHVITGSGVDASAVLDGVTVTQGNADGVGDNRHGGGVYIMEGSPTISNCTVTFNNSSNGGGMSIKNGSPTIVLCIFERNCSGDLGGAIYHSEGSRAIVKNSLFSRNESFYGGAIYNFNSDTTIRACDFIHNYAFQGGAIYNSESSPLVVDCQFEEHEILDAGGGMYNTLRSDSIVIDCLFRGGVAYLGAGIANVFDSDSTLINCIFQTNSAAFGGGVYNYESSPSLTNCLLESNSAPTGVGGGMYNQESHPSLTNCTLAMNEADEVGGAIYNTSSSDPVVSNSILWANIAPLDSQIANLSLSTSLIIHCDIESSGGSGNWDPKVGIDGGGNIDADPLFADAGKGAFVLSSGSACIDAGKNDSVPVDQFDLDEDGDTSEPIPYDLNGDMRFIDDHDTPDTGDGKSPVVDMGSYEFQIAGSCDGDANDDGSVDPLDVGFVLSRFGCDIQGNDHLCQNADVNGDGTVDPKDMGLVLSLFGYCP